MQAGLGLQPTVRPTQTRQDAYYASLCPSSIGLRKSPGARRPKASLPALTNPARSQAPTQQTASGNAGQETAPDAPFIEQQSASPPVIPLSATESPKQPASVTAGPSPTPHFLVPIGAFYEKLPPHLVAPERPDLTRLIEIAEEDVVIEQESQEATVPLSILSLSCPDIFVRPVGGSDEIQITFLVNRQLSTAVAEPHGPNCGAAAGESNSSARVSATPKSPRTYPQKAPQPQLRLPDLNSPGRPKTPRRGDQAPARAYSLQLPARS